MKKRTKYNLKIFEHIEAYKYSFDSLYFCYSHYKQYRNFFYSLQFVIHKSTTERVRGMFQQTVSRKRKVEKSVTDRTMVFILHPVRTLYVSQPLGVYLLAEYVRSRAAKKTITSAGQTSPVVSARFVRRPLLSSHSSNLRNVSASGACTVLFTRLENHRHTFFSIEIRFGPLSYIFMETPMVGKMWLWNKNLISKRILHYFCRWDIFLMILWFY